MFDVNSKSAYDDINTLKLEIEETYRGVLELVYELGQPDSLNEITQLKQEVGRLSSELEETYRGVIELATNLQTEEQNIISLTEQAGLGLWRWSTTTNQIKANQQWFNIQGINSNVFSNDMNGWEALFHPDDLPNFLQQRSNFVNGKQLLLHSEHRLRHPEKGWLWVQLSARLTDRSSTDSNFNIYGILININTRKQTELKLQRINQELEQRNLNRSREIERINQRLLDEVREHQRTEHALRQANEAKSIFLASMSHELRTPLQSILGFSQLMQLDKGLSKKQIENLASINRSGHHLHDLINDVLNVTEIESGRITGKKTDFNIYELLDDIKTMFSLQVKTKNIYLNINIADNVPYNIKTDVISLRQVLINLLGNAVKFTDDGGVDLQLTMAQSSEQLQFEIHDTGPGIKEIELGRLFQPFEQGMAGIAKGGTGLGLVISREHVQRNGGKLSVNSVLGKGSCFSFTYPFTKAVQDKHVDINFNELTISLASGRDSRLVLVVDNHRQSLTFITQCLERIGFRTIEANNGKLAIKQAITNQPDLVIIDLQLPEMKGDEAIQQIREQPAIRNIPIIAVTASTFEHTEQALEMLGANTLLIKPFMLADITNALSKIPNIDLVYGQSTKKPATPDSNPLTVKALRMLPDELQLRLRTATEEGDINSIRACVDDVEKTNHCLAGRIGRLVAQYDYHTLLEMLK